MSAAETCCCPEAARYPPPRYHDEARGNVKHMPTVIHLKIKVLSLIWPCFKTLSHLKDTFFCQI